jgi:hypothetical protein
MLYVRLVRLVSLRALPSYRAIKPSWGHPGRHSLTFKRA